MTTREHVAAEAPTPAWIAAMEAVADAAAEAGGELGAEDFAVLLRAGASAQIEPAFFASVVRVLSERGRLTAISRADFNAALGLFWGHGFRDPAMPEVADDYRAFLDHLRRALGFDDAAFAEILAEAAGAAARILTEPSGSAPEPLTGVTFLLALRGLCDRRGHPIPNLPPRTYMTRSVAGKLRRAVHALGLDYGQYVMVLAEDGGGCMRTCDLDETGMRRVFGRCLAAGYVEAEPPPRVEGRPGYVTQAQVNLIWKLAHDIGVTGEAPLAEWLHAMLGLDGGLPALTAAGARRVLDRLIPPVAAMRDHRAKVRASAVAKD